ncbi:MAG: hypothetical protein GY943_36130 [Chloroflexi bacterium]|nr:hypothetical protein [Chloroflexota bacterium]
MKTISDSSWVYELATAGYVWDNNAGRYRSRETGRFVSESAIRSDLDRFNETIIRENLSSVTDKLLNGNITLEQWQRRLANELKDAWRLNQMIGRGGKSQMTQADYGRLGGRLRFEYDRLNRLAIEIKAGMLTEAQIRARVGLYANAPRVGFYDGLTAAQQAAGLVEERRVLNPAEHCSDCIGYADQGWQPIGTLPMPGEKSQCMRNCKCTMEYR